MSTPKSGSGPTTAPTSAPQLDLFVDTREVMLANDLIAALHARDVASAAKCLDLLRAEAPALASLDSFEVLVNRLRHAEEGKERKEPNAQNAAELAAAADDLTHRVEPAARKVMGADAKRFVAPWFRELADLARAQPYDRDHRRAHAASLLLEAGDFAAAEAAALTIPGYDERPTSLAWLSIARYHQHGIDAARPSLLSLALRSPMEFERTRDLLDDPALHREWTAFLGASEWESIAEAELPRWFPAWYVEEFGAISVVVQISLTIDPPGRALQSVQSLLAMERGGVSAALLKERENLRRLNEDLYRLYMAKRAGVRT